jgi:hypothetical protein
MSQLDIFSNQIPSNVTDAIAWSTKIDGRLYISFKMDKPIWIGDNSLVQWLKNVAEVGNYGSDENQNVVIEIKNYPQWLIDEVKKYKYPLGGSNHPVNRVEWSR